MVQNVVRAAYDDDFDLDKLLAPVKEKKPVNHVKKLSLYSATWYGLMVGVIVLVFSSCFSLLDWFGNLGWAILLSSFFVRLFTSDDEDDKKEEKPKHEATNRMLKVQNEANKLWPGFFNLDSTFNDIFDDDTVQRFQNELSFAIITDQVDKVQAILEQNSKLVALLGTVNKIASKKHFYEFVNEEHHFDITALPNYDEVTSQIKENFKRVDDQIYQYMVVPKTNHLINNILKRGDESEMQLLASDVYADYSSKVLQNVLNDKD